jgi:hypothetical protein
MERTYITDAPQLPAVGTIEATKSAVSWAAILAGTVAAVAATLILLTLGSGLGFAAVSPWTNSGASAAAIGTTAAIWFIIVQWLSAGLGGYLTGRLRTRWVGTHVHEVFFRDTTHGFVTWAAATIVLAIVLAGAAFATAGAGARAVAAMGSGAARGAAASASQAGNPVDAYDVDTLFRSAQPDTSPTSSAGDGHGEATRILARGLSAGDLSSADRTYLAQLVAGRTGISQDEAQKRVDDAMAQLKAAELKARQAADTARKAAAKAALLTALAMLIGAFIASAAAALGGHERDLHP